MEKIMDEESELDQEMGTDVAEERAEKVTHKEIVEAMPKMNSGKATGSTEVNLEIIIASGKIVVEVGIDLCQRV